MSVEEVRDQYALTERQKLLADAINLERAAGTLRRRRTKHTFWGDLIIRVLEVKASEWRKNAGGRRGAPDRPDRDED